MRPRIWILCLCCSLLGLWPVDTLAKPKATPAPPPVQTLSDAEQICQMLGTLAHAVTVDRNAGVSLFTTLHRLRVRLHATPNVLQATEELARMVYGDVQHRATPGQVRQAVEIGCHDPESPAHHPSTWERR